jgi:16S rRNA processing protein RimM
MKEPAAEWVSIGRIGRPKGLRGEVRVQVYNPESRLLEETRSVAAGYGPNSLQPLSVAKYAREPKSAVVTFEGISTLEKAQQLTGQELYVRRSDLPKLAVGEYYCCDLIGFTVVLESGKRVGTLRKVLATASNDIYEIEAEEGEVLLPAIPDVVLRVDLDDRKIVVRIPEVVDAV